MSAWEQIGALLQVLVLAFIAWERRQTLLDARNLRSDVSGANRALVEFVKDSLRPPPICTHDDHLRQIHMRDVFWCAHCGAVKIGEGPWRSPGDDDTPVTRRTRELKG